jgi:hypothetical protein
MEVSAMAYQREQANLALALALTVLEAPSTNKPSLTEFK